MKLQYRETIREACECFQRNIKLVLIAVGVEYIASFAFKALQTYGENATKIPNTVTLPFAQPYFILSLIVSIVSIVGVIAVALVQPLLIISVVNSEHNTSASFSTMVSYILRSAGRIVGTTILVGLVVVGGYLLLIVPGIIFSLMYSQAYYLSLIDGLGPMESLKQSKILTKFNKKKIFNIYFLVGVLSLVIYMPLAFLKIPSYITNLFEYAWGGYMMILNYTIFKKLKSFQQA
ncbi:hypothetical protein COY90_01545 [Candidatus Roizmanbacteria bacterium CG_4_10_14_0_8_um_filter_39_9]|uniref:Glycerophosphoryl diester phosphodiesterase membrane domain-containing protein n=1 Tax=Candidatus Roizmanbacteria bacterium CG_4_10_14_0_8_um_filter_39_9 TaxID=1974829 RepID=A0A2M7QDI2_9BACT|nr:MAG: hypothetical protein COY90_01545 [Candidatus Roizmanbacteria bacterium CG_4_10_14_0_8_um_filter_39_9]